MVSLTSQVVMDNSCITSNHEIELLIVSYAEKLSRSKR